MPTSSRPSDESLEEDAQKATVVSERLFIILVLEEENEEQEAVRGENGE